MYLRVSFSCFFCQSGYNFLSIGLSASSLLLYLLACLPIKQFLSVYQSIFQSNTALSIGLSANPADSCLSTGLSVRPGLLCPSIGLSANRAFFYVSSDLSVSPLLFCPVCLPVQLLLFFLSVYRSVRQSRIVTT